MKSSTYVLNYNINIPDLSPTPFFIFLHDTSMALLSYSLKDGTLMNSAHELPEAHREVEQL